MWPTPQGHVAGTLVTSGSVSSSQPITPHYPINNTCQRVTPSRTRRGVVTIIRETDTPCSHQWCLYGQHVENPRFAISTCTARYQAVPPKNDYRRPIEGEIDHRWSIEGEIDRRQSIEGEKRKKKKKKRKRRRGEKKEVPPFPAPSLPAGRLHTVAACGSPAHRRCPRPRVIFLPLEETERLPARGERSRRQIRLSTSSLLALSEILISPEQGFILGFPPAPVTGSSNSHPNRDESVRDSHRRQKTFPRKRSRSSSKGLLRWRSSDARGEGDRDRKATQLARKEGQSWNMDHFGWHGLLKKAGFGG
ncbi:hypothetical protein BHE74_00002480 [Ensete ventricosum]|nr:hypothetical protein GW17_00043371 [Ensete ventricosum]RWW88623.1 hypothetical protein BHE74_00002480 [Ensete ventricosum]